MNTRDRYRRKLRESQPRDKDCSGVYVPWTCGFCPRIRECKPRQVAR